ncbi:long-chain-fatty-acid--CoA ligase [Aneurinibacillus sp. Ricciae_BoGa-3]|uniref:class I adenylate-forming enzyme family protein n=1 Tax=Aneurinibacillus sp. Ricciae_BoGa-3 TaxID=3022697 RepID=UPI00234226EA|nr:long-chain-fatty-acid--CoA ligase [Aneurinibacillus sp. Ricciae_BoGa-3]WCK56583.1 long-chain-fatty-acid--CoA ligase [Aneurinibacillus sp. Ricciae_BoGa-3]
MHTYDILLQHVKTQPDKAVTVFEGRETSYQHMAARSQKLGHYLKSRGLEKGDAVALLLSNSDNFVTAYFACQAAGLVVLPVNTRLAARELEYILNHSEAKALIYDPEFLCVIKELAPKVSSLQEYIYTEGDNNMPGAAFEEAIRQGDEGLVSHQDEDDTAVIFYTSGTTGKPKGVMLTHRNCTSIAAMWKQAMGLQNNERVQIVAPLFHCAAAHVFMLPTLAAGATLVIERSFSPKQALQTLIDEKITLFFGVPAMYTLLLNLPDIQHVHAPALRMLAYGAAPMPYELVKKIKQLFPQVKVQNLYGQTENSPGATTLKDRFALDKISSVGEPLPGCQVRVADEQGRELRPGEIGEIIVKGPHVMKGYLKNPEATARTIRDGWMFSGDLGRMEDGLLYIVDRKKDMIIRGGENIYPIEVEEVLYEMPAVLEAAVVGTPHPLYGEVPKAYIVLKQGQSLTADQVIHFSSERLAKYKIPAEIEFIDTLPRNASGKILKTVLRGEISFS